MQDHFNGLTPAEAERLAMLAEEAAEVIQAVGKILRHGYASYHPDDLTPVADGGKITRMPRMGALDNRALLMNELADFNSVQLLMEGSGDVFRTGEEIERVMARKLTYAHHQEKN